MRHFSSLVILRFLFVIGFLGIIGCDKLQPDKGKSIVNAAGLSIQEVMKCLQTGVSINQKSRKYFGWTPLISAIYHRKTNVIEFLLANGADVNLGDDNNQTPICWTIEVWEVNTNLVKQLVQSGADPNIADRFGKDAFDYAKSKKNWEILQDILSFGSASEQGTSPPKPESP